VAVRSTHGSLCLIVHRKAGRGRWRFLSSNAGDVRTLASFGNCAVAGRVSLARFERVSQGGHCGQTLQSVIVLELGVYRLVTRVIDACNGP